MKTTNFTLLGMIIAVAVLLLLPAQAHAARSGFVGQVKPGGTTIRRWPSDSSPTVTGVAAEKYIWVYSDYQDSTWYLVSKCSSSSKAACAREDNLDNDPSNDPLVGFARRSTIRQADAEYDPGHTHPAASRPISGGSEYIVRTGVRELYLRSVDNGRNHPYGLLRANDRFIIRYIVADHQWAHGWAVGPGINPRMRYGRVAWRRGRFLRRR